MTRVLSVVAILFASCLFAGCVNVITRSSTTISKSGSDLNALSTNYEIRSSNLFDVSLAYTFYSLNDVHHSFVNPAFSPQASGPTTATVASDTTLKSVQFDGPNNYQQQFSAENQDLTVPLVRDSGNDSILAWGRWTPTQGRVSIQVPGSGTSTVTGNNSLHYIFGVATPNSAIPLAGTATFNLLGNTSPTRTDGQGGFGTVTAGQLAVQWGGAGPMTRVAVSLNGNVGSTAFQVQTPGGLAGVASSPVTYDASTQTFSGSWLAQVGNTNRHSASGFFAGPNAGHAGLTYSTPLPTGGGTFSNTVSVQGAAAFKQ